MTSTTLLKTREWSADEMMTVSAARSLHNGITCFVGIGIPSTAAILAKATHAPDLVLIYESGTIDTKPSRLPLSIGDGELAQTALTIVSIPEIFNYWLQSGRIAIGFLGAAQVDKFANINSTIIGSSYDHPSVRLPGAGGAPEISGACGETTIICRQSTRTFLEKIDFITSVGYGAGPGSRESFGLTGRGPTAVITDLGILEPDPETCELIFTQIHENATVDQVRSATGWPIKIAKDLKTTEPPTGEELRILRILNAPVNIKK
jgi:glutaconate CoA-transferase subunit B